MQLDKDIKHPPNCFLFLTFDLNDVLWSSKKNTKDEGHSRTYTMRQKWHWQIMSHWNDKWYYRKFVNYCRLMIIYQIFQRSAIFSLKYDIDEYFLNVSIFQLPLAWLYEFNGFHVETWRWMQNNGYSGSLCSWIDHIYGLLLFESMRCTKTSNAIV